MGSLSSASITVLELAKSRSEFSRLSSSVFELVVLSVNTLPFSCQIKTSWSAHLASSIARSTSVACRHVCCYDGQWAHAASRHRCVGWCLGEVVQAGTVYD